MSILKKTIVSLITLSLLSSLFIGCNNKKTDTNSSKIINVFNCGDYIDTDLIAKFEEETGYKIIYSTYDTNEIMYSKVKSGSTQYDLVFPSDYMVQKMISENLLEKIDFNNVPNYKYIDNKYKNLAYDPKNQYSVPYLWGTFGIIYDADKVKENINSWDILWDKKYKNNIIMFNSLRDAFAISLSRLGYSMNSTNKKEVKEAADELLLQKKNSRAWMVDETKDAILNGEAVMATVWSGDAMYILDENTKINLKYVVPETGSNMWVDSMCIPKGSKNKKGAEAFINFLTEPKNSLQNVDYIGYYTPNTKTFEMLDKEVKETYPSNEIIKNCEVFTNLPNNILEYYSDEWIRVTGS